MHVDQVLLNPLLECVRRQHIRDEIESERLLA